MCDTYILEIGYICYDCQQEFKEKMTAKETPPTTDTEIHLSLILFMQSVKVETWGHNVPQIDDFFKRHTQ